MLERLEDRRMLALATIMLDNGVLRIDGSDAHETLVVYKQDAEVRVSVAPRADKGGGVFAWIKQETFKLADVRAIEINAAGGNDYIAISLRLKIDAVVFGGAGSDTIQTGAGNDRLFGGDDLDVLNGTIGNDLLSGDAGNDRLTAIDDVDTLLGGEGDDHLTVLSGRHIVNGNGGRDTGRFNVVPAGLKSVERFASGFRTTDWARASLVALQAASFRGLPGYYVQLTSPDGATLPYFGADVRVDTDTNRITADLVTYERFYPSLIPEGGASVVVNAELREAGRVRLGILPDGTYDVSVRYNGDTVYKGMLAFNASTPSDPNLIFIDRQGDA